MFKNCFMISVVVLLLCFNFVHGQKGEFATDKGSILISDGLNFTFAEGGTQISALPSPLLYFVKTGLGIGIEKNYYAYIYQGGMATIGLGPKIAYFFSEPESKIKPYISTGFFYAITIGGHSYSGYRFKIGAGICPMISNKICLPLEIGYLLNVVKSNTANFLYLDAKIGLFIF